jgi:lipopolysaccharide/colanic/teichoic acid biosynthesis glycosyltransferase
MAVGFPMLRHEKGDVSDIGEKPFVQRVFDFIASFLGICLLSPVFVIVGAFVALHDGGPIFFRAMRVGKGGVLFPILKFRTMIQNADKIGGGITMSGDNRVTPVGRFLRKHKIDELPQLINVFRGQMSFVGARPEDPRYVALYTDEQKKILAYRPGVTSPASLAYRNEEEILKGENPEKMYAEDVLPRKLAIDLAYLSRRSFLSDLKVILQTIGG